MTVALRSLRVDASLNGQQFTSSATAMAGAIDKLGASAQATGVSLARQDAAAARSGGVLATLSRQYIAGYGQAQKFEGALSTLGRALDKGAVDLGRAETILEGIYRKYGLMADGAEIAARGHQQLAAAVTTVNSRFSAQVPAGNQFAAINDNIADSSRNLAHQQQNLRFQLIDTATSLASGMPLYMVMMQQGGQIATIWGPGEGGIGRAFKETASMAAGLVARLWPLAAVAGAVGAAYVALSRNSAAASLEVSSQTQLLAEQAGGYQQVSGKISDMLGVQRTYDQALAATKKAHGDMAASIIADTEREFNAKKSLLELELQYQQALIATQQASIAQAGLRLKAEIGSQVQTNMYGAYQGYRDDRIGDFVRLPDDITGLAKTQETIDASPISFELKKMRAELELNEIAANKLGDALKVTFNPAGTPKVGGEKKAGRERETDFERTLRRLQEQTAAETEETRVVNLSTFARERQAAVQALLTAAQRDGLTVGKAFASAQELIGAASSGLTPVLAAERERILGVADAWGKARTATEAAAEQRRRAEEAMAFTRDSFKGVISDFTNSIRDGASVWEAFADAAGNALDKITDKLLDDVLGAVFKVSGAGTGVGGGDGILSSIFGGLFGGGGASADPWSGMRVANAFGNVYRSRSLSAYSNQIVDKPTCFAFAKGAGLMGEAGPEAIMPLRRDATGRLGVSVSGRAAANDTGGETVIRIALADGLVAEILRKSEESSVKIVKANNEAQANIRQNGGEF